METCTAKGAEMLQLVIEDLFGIDVDVPASITTKTTEEVVKEGGSQGFFSTIASCFTRWDRQWCVLF